MSALKRVKQINPSIINALDDRPNLTLDQGLLAKAFSAIVKPSRSEGRAIYLADISPAIDIYNPNNKMEFVDDIFDIEAKIKWKESSG